MQFSPNVQSFSLQFTHFFQYKNVEQSQFCREIKDEQKNV